MRQVDTDLWPLVQSRGAPGPLGTTGEELLAPGVPMLPHSAAEHAGYVQRPGPR